MKAGPAEIVATAKRTEAPELTLASVAEEGELRVLMLEDVPADAELAPRSLEKAGIKASVSVVDCRADFVAQIRRARPDLILADYSLGGFDGAQALEIAHITVPDVPFIFVTGTLGDEQAVELMKEGAWDYVTKENLLRLAPTILRALEDAADSRERERLERRERDRIDRLEALERNSHDIVLTILISVSDETWIGGEPKNRHACQRIGSKQGLTDKTPVLTLINMVTGEVRSQVVPLVTAATLRKVMSEQVDMANSDLFTDSAKAYIPLGKEFRSHQSVNHHNGERATGFRIKPGRRPSTPAAWSRPAWTHW